MVTLKIAPMEPGKFLIKIIVAGKVVRYRVVTCSSKYEVPEHLENLLKSSMEAMERL